MFEGGGRGEGGTAKSFEEFVECECPEATDDVVLLEDAAQGNGDLGVEWVLKEVVDSLSEPSLSHLD